jgi:hypothetical protein
MNTYYSIRYAGLPHEKRALYRVIPGGKVERWIAPDRAWKTSALFKDEAAVMRGGAFRMTPSMARSLQSYSRRMLKKKFPLVA